METVSRLNSVLGTTHSLTLDAARDASLRKTANPQLRNVQLKKLLDSRNEREVLEGLRKVIAISHRPPPPTEPQLFSSVLKNIASPSTHVKKLVYIHLLQYAEAVPDEALLSINTIQKTLSSSDPHVRALALRVMSSIRVPVISQIVSLAVKKGITDMSPLVRKAAALAIPKCARLDPSTLPQLEDYISILLGDKQYFVAGAAVQAFMETFGWERVDLIHKHYRKLVRQLVDMEEWGQVATLRLMAGYARQCFPKRFKRMKRRDEREQETEQSFYDEPEHDGVQQIVGNGDEDTILEPILDPDLSVLLRQTQLLLHSRNSAVIIAATRLYLALAPGSTYLTSCIGPLIALLRAPPSIAEAALHNTLQVALIRPQGFLRHLTHFLLKSRDSEVMQKLKLEMLTILFPHANTRGQSLILAELQHFCSTPTSAPSSQALVRECVRAIGRCAQASPPGSKIANRCMALLLSHLSITTSTSPSTSSDLLVGESLTVIRHLIQANPKEHINTITLLAKRLDNMQNPTARASVVWLVGEYATVDADEGTGGKGSIAPDVLRILVKGFVQEEEVVRAQIVLLAAKVYLQWLNAYWRQHPEAQQQQQQQQQSSDNSSSPHASQNTSLNPTTKTPSYDLPEEEGGFRDSSSSPSYQQTTSTTQQPERTSPGAVPPPNEQNPTTSALNHSHPIPHLYTHTLTLSHYDTSYDLRDRTRTYRALLPPPPLPSTSTSHSPHLPLQQNTQLATLLLLAPKPVPNIQSETEARRGFMLGSASLVLGREVVGEGGLRGYVDLPGWVEEGREPDGGVREEDVEGGGYGVGREVRSAASRLDGGVRGVVKEVGAGGGGGGGGGGGLGSKSLDDWLEESGVEVEEGEESESDESDSEMASGDENEGGSEEDESEDEDEEDESDESADERVELNARR